MESSGKTPLERWYPSAGSIYLTQARARNAPGTGQSTPTSKNQEFGGLQPRDERSRHPSLGLPRVGAESDRGRPIFSGPVNWWRKSLASTFFSIQAGCTSKPLSDSAASACSSFSSRATQSVTCFGLEMYCSCPSSQRKVACRARRQARLPDMRLWPTPAARRPA